MKWAHKQSRKSESHTHTHGQRERAEQSNRATWWEKGVDTDVFNPLGTTIAKLQRQRTHRPQTPTRYPYAPSRMLASIHKHTSSWLRLYSELPARSRIIGEALRRH